MKLKSILLSLFAVLLLMTACGNQTEDSDNAKLSKFYLFNDSIAGLDDIVFTVDNVEGLIYNKDSADFGMRVDSAFPYIVAYEALEEILIDDSIVYNLKDTFFYDFTNPVKIRTLAKDGKSEKEYTVKVIVHQVNPDTFLWEGANSQIYTDVVDQENAIVFLDKLYLYTRTATGVVCHTSENASKWERTVTTGLPITADVYRIVAGANAMYYSDGLKLYSSEDGTIWNEMATATGVKHLLFAMRGKVYAQKGEMPGATLVAYPEVNGSAWEDITTLPVEFPQTGMTVCVASAPNKNERVFVLGGRDSDGKLLKSLWSSDNGSYWADLTIGKEPFTPREYVGMTQYAGGIFIFGGKDEDGICEDRQLFSADHGLTWTEVDAMAMVPDLCVDRYASSLLSNSFGYIYIIGGRAEDGEFIKNAWRGLRYASLPGFDD